MQKRDPKPISQRPKEALKKPKVIQLYFRYHKWRGTDASGSKENFGGL